MIRITWVASPSRRLMVWAGLLFGLLSAGPVLGFPITQVELDTVTIAAQQGVAQGSAIAESSGTGSGSASFQSGMAFAAVVLTLITLGEALGAAGIIGEGIAEAAALGTVIGQGLAAGGAAAVASVSIITVLALGVVLSIAVGAIILSAAMPKVAAKLTESHPVSRGSIGTGEQTDDTLAAIQAAANPQGVLNINVSIDPVTGNLRTFSVPGGRGLDVEVVVPDNGISVPPSEVNITPQTQQTITLTPAPEPEQSFPGLPADLSGIPGLGIPGSGLPGSDPAPDSPDSDGGMGLMMVFESQSNGGREVPAIPTWVMTLLAGLSVGAWSLRRRLLCS